MTLVPGSKPDAAPSVSDRSLLVLGVIGLAVALTLYVPWRARPFDLWDFPEFLPVLLRHHTFLAQWSAMVEHYASEGRFNVLPYGVLALKWNVFGWHTSLWQTTRFAQMMAIVAGVYLIARNFTSGRVPAALAAGLFISATTATTAWIRLTMGEPLALMFLLGAIALACRFQGSSSPRSVALGIALLMLGALLSKEMIAATFPFVVLLAWSRTPNGSIDRVRDSQRNRALLGACVMILLPASVAIAAVALHAPKQSFSGSYGSSPLTVEGFLVRFAAFIIPAWPGREPSALTAPVNLCFLSLVCFGWYIAARQQGQRMSTLRLLGLLILLPALGALAYLPWPSFGDFYGLPFLVAPAILLSVALDAIDQRFPSAGPVGYGLALVVVLGTAFQAHHTAREITARDEVNFALVDRIAQYSSVDTIYVGSPARPQEAWRLGARIARSRSAFTRERALPRPPVIDITCSELREREGRQPGNLVLVSYAHVCGTIHHPSVTLIRRFFYLDPSSLSVRSDSFRVDLRGPAGYQGGGETPALWPPNLK